MPMKSPYGDYYVLRIKGVGIYQPSTLSVEVIANNLKSAHRYYKCIEAMNFKRAAAKLIKGGRVYLTMPTSLPKVYEETRVSID